MKFENYAGIAFSAIFFLILFAIIPMRQFHGLALMPGDLGDTRLNNYFLENIYQFLIGGSKSLWHLGFFAPFPYIIGFSDNLFGASPIYLVARLFGYPGDTAFQFWFLFGYLANYIAAYVALRSLGLDPLAATIGSAIFSFALPVSAHVGHAQLHYRFGIPLSVAALIGFLNRGNPWFLVRSGFWLVWQFYCGVYIGFFTLILFVAIGATYIFVRLIQAPREILAMPANTIAGWRAIGTSDRIRFAGASLLLAAAMGLLFYPYLMVSMLYHVRRDWAEISLMLPRPQSYFLADRSFLWGTPAAIFDALPMRHEHQMFMGAGPWILLILGLFAGARNRVGLTFALMLSALLIPVVLTLYIGKMSLWALFYRLPLASAIRAITRLDQVLLFPVAYLAGLGTVMLQRNGWWSKALLGALIVGMTFEFSQVSVQTMEKEEGRDRLAATEKLIPSSLPPDAILFFAQKKGPFYADEIDAMWTALSRKVETLNGYSGNHPPGSALVFGTDCAELAIRLASYINFIGRPNDEQLYLALRKRVIPIGFNDCSQYAQVAPIRTTARRSYTREEIKAISLAFVGLDKHGDDWRLRIRLSNTSDQSIATDSAVRTPVRLSWRFVIPGDNTKPGWDTRFGLPLDIPAHGQLEVTIPIKVGATDAQKLLEVSLVQEGVFWAHDIGIPPLVVPGSATH